jgi:GcrA cell cycle regulator
MTKRKEVKLKPGVPSSWLPEHNEALRHLAGLGYSASQIATVLGRTRNAVIGRASRMQVQLGIAKDGVSVRRVITDKPSRAKRIRHRQAISVAKRPEPALARYVPERVAVAIVPAPVAEPVLAGEPVTLDQLTRHSCRFIAGDPLKVAAPFCGAQRKAGSAYCAAHHALCYVAPPGIKETRLRVYAEAAQ